MVVPTEVPINPDVLLWALRENGETPADLADRMHLDADVIESWLRGDDSPTRGQWSELADKLRRPRSAFLLPAAPAESIAPELRTARGRAARGLERDELLQIRRARRLQERIGALLEELDEAESVITPATHQSEDPSAAGRRLREWLGITVDEQLAWDTGPQAFRTWRAALEDHGFLVLMPRLGPEGVRGFSLPHPLAPLVAVNSAETYEARSFTLIHELAHISSDTAGSCDWTPALSDEPGVERWCDRLAAALLMPAEHTRRVVATAAAEGTNDEVALARHVATRFHTSLRATAVRLGELGLVEGGLFDRIERLFPRLDRDKSGGGGNGERRPAIRLREVGDRAAQIMVDAVNDGRLDEASARDILRVDGHDFEEIAGRLEAAPQ